MESGASAALWTYSNMTIVMQVRIVHKNASEFRKKVNLKQILDLSALWAQRLWNNKKLEV